MFCFVYPLQILGGAPALPLAALFDQVLCTKLSQKASNIVLQQAHKAGKVATALLAAVTSAIAVK